MPDTLLNRLHKVEFYRPLNTVLIPKHRKIGALGVSFFLFYRGDRNLASNKGDASPLKAL